MIVVVFNWMLLPAIVSADGITGYLDLSYSLSDSRTKDAEGALTDTKVSEFRQQLNLTVSRTLFPNLKLYVNGIVDNDRTTSKTGDIDTVSKTLILRPYIDLTLRTQLFIAGVNYTRTDKKNTVSDLPSTTDVTEQYTGFFGWRPEGFPSLDLRFVETNSFDKLRIVRDNTDDFLTIESQYEPMKGLGLRYRGSYDDSKARLDESETKTWTHIGQVTYDGNFFRDRVTVSTSYQINRRSTEVVASGKGEVSFPLSPFAGLATISDTPTMVVLDSDPPLIDGNTAVSAGINLGLPPLGGDTKPRNIGLDFFATTELNEIFIYIDRELPAEIEGSFSWDIYTSQDNINWNLSTPLVHAVFDTIQKRFEIRIPNLKTRYIKVVVNPLSPAVPGASGFPDIFVTEMQAAINVAIPDLALKTDSTTHNFSLDSRVRLLDTPRLYFETSYLFLKFGVSTTSTQLSNSLNVSHRFNSIFSGNARVGREDSSASSGNTSAYVYNASINATPLPTLSHSLSFSGRAETNPIGDLTRNSVFLNNTAYLYKGFTVYVSGGLGSATSEFGRKQTSTLLNGGVSIIPNRFISLNLNYSQNNTKESGGGRPDSSIPMSRTDLGLTFRPFQLLYAVASWGTVNQAGRRQTLQNYGVSWTPFPGGQLQCGLNYNESISNDITGDPISMTNTSGKTRIMLGDVRWNMTPRSYLDITYQVTDSSASTSTGGSSKSKILGTTLRVSF